MIQIDNTLISLDIIEKEFVCDYAKCKGICCVEGDSGAPLTNTEIEQIEALLPELLPLLAKQNQEIIRSQGVFYIDSENEKVTSLVNNAECAFVIHEKGMISCAIERLYEQGKSEIPKPMSCHLYPIRARKYRDFEALNYDIWHICKDAVCKGKTEQKKVFQFLKTSLTRKYGEAWYMQLEEIARQWEIDKIKIKK
jgi:hypothetical protein